MVDRARLVGPLTLIVMLRCRVTFTLTRRVNCGVYSTLAKLQTSS